MDNLCRSPMAEAILKKIIRNNELKISSRGLVVLFPEPYNLRVRSILLNHEIVMENGVSKQLREEDFDLETLILVMDRDEKIKIQEEYECAQNVYTIMEFAGGSGDIMDPYGGDLQLYDLFYEALSHWITLLEQIFYENDQTFETKEKKE